MFFSLSQNACQNECPEAMVEFIHLAIPLEADVDNPLVDAAFMEQIGAKPICDFPDWFELKNAVTGTRFTFAWFKIKADSGAAYLVCSLRREEKIFGH